MASLFKSKALALAGDGNPSPAADGLIVVEAVQEQSCLAMRVDVPVGKALSGIRWFNGTDSVAFTKVLCASGAEEFPPTYDQFMVMEENVVGQVNAWSDLEFMEPVASLTNTLFVILQYPPFYDAPEDQPSLGVGFLETEAEALYFVSLDGDRWCKLADRVELLLEPTYVDREVNMVALSGPGGGGVELLETESYANGLSSFPNPFNPETKLALTLEKPGHIQVNVYDVRGHLVRNLYTGHADQWIKELSFDGRDDHGRGLSSGVYWARVKGNDFTLKTRLVLIK